MSESAKANTADLTAGKLFNLDGKVALVTGGASGIGLMCSQALAANGAKVYITGRHMDSLKKAAELYSLPSGSGGNGMLIPLELDVTDKSSISKLYEQIKAKEKELAILVNNAGISGAKHEVEKADESAEALSKELLDHEVKDWQDVFATNVIGPYFMAATFLPLLAAATKNNYGFSGTVVNISSISGITNTTQHHIPYNVSKSAAIQLTYMLAQEYSKAGVKVRVNSIAPGVFPSGMTSEVDDDQKSKIDADGYRDEKGIRAGRPGRDVDMAQALLALVTNQYINGEILKVDGGYLLGNQ